MLKNIKNILKTSSIPKNCLERYLPLDEKYAHSLIGKGINFAGISALCSGYSIGSPEASSRHMIIFTKSGRGYLQTPLEEYHLTPGTYISVPPGSSYTFGVSDNKWDILWFYILDIPFWQILKNSGIDFQKTSMISKLELAMEGYLSESKSNNLAASIFADLIVCYLEQIFEINGEEEKDDTRNKLEMIWHEIDENPAKKWSKSELSQKLYVSSSTFDRMVKRYYGVTPWQKIIQIRMEKAKILLSKTDYPIQVIADRLGYANEFIFSTAFKKYSSLAPKYYRLNL